MPTLDVILVNRNSARRLYNCLSSIAQTNRSGFELRCVCVVDDASTDNSLDGIAELRLPLRILRNTRHTGYGASCNLAAAESTADYLLFLNNDTMLRPDSLTAPISYMEQAEHSEVGIVGIQLYDSKGAVSRCCARFPTVSRMVGQAFGFDRLAPSLVSSHFMIEWEHSETREVDQVIGAFTLMRRALFEELGGYDERFFVYMEDVDLAFRMSWLGYKSVYLIDASAFHEGGGTFRRCKAESLFFLLRSKIQYAFRHFGGLRGSAVAVVTMMVEPISRIIFAVSRGSLADVKATARAWFMLWTSLPSTVRRIRKGGRRGALNCRAVPGSKPTPPVTSKVGQEINSVGKTSA
jgi:N-acetylglucosaminyl-diphospho-decaprenol L-rhamnosyltransferase